MGYTEIVQILMLLTNNPNAPEKYGRTPINEAVRIIGHLNIVKILVNLTDNPNAHYKNNFIGLKQKLISNST